jgi:two-component system cell cycle response regulator
MSKPKTVLIIEDDPDQIFLYETEFTIHGFQVKIAPNGLAGLEAAEKEQPDLILLDEVMEEMTGLVTLKKLKENQKTKNIPVILFTNLEKDEKEQEARQLGAVDFVVKSKVMPKDLVARVKQCLKK